MLEPMINDWVGDMQRGFLQGRSMLSNVVDVDYEAMKISLRHPHGAIVLFDFEAAFPSVSQEYMWEVLSHIGFADGPLRATQRLYTNSFHYVRVKGQAFPGIVASSAVRQGCPLSPFLFALVADILLRQLAHAFPHNTIRAFADDTAMVTPAFPRDASKIMGIFSEFAKISNLRLNITKTVLVPLWEAESTHVRHWLQNDFPQWSGVDIAWAAKYLGMFVGPLKG